MEEKYEGLCKKVSRKGSKKLGKQVRLESSKELGKKVLTKVAGN